MNLTKKNIAIILTPLILLFAYRVKIDFKDKASYLLESLWTFTPFVLIFTVVMQWYDSNKIFAGSLLAVLVANMFVGVYFHIKKGSFDISDFLKKNLEMIFYTGVVYIALYTLHINITENLGSEIFLSLIQVVSLLYPISKICKNVFILSDGKHPPEFLMQKLYNFEKNGDLNEFFNTKSNTDG